MKQKTLLLVFLLFSYFLNAQQNVIDSLKNELDKAETLVVKLNIYKSLTKELNLYSFPKKSIPIYKQAIDIARKNNDKKFEAKVNRYLHVTYTKLEDTIKANKYLETALVIDKKAEIISGVLLDLNLYGAFYIDTQRYMKAIEILNEAIKIFNKKPNSSIICQIYTNLGIAYSKTNNIEKELSCYFKSIEYAEKFKTYDDKIFALHHIGVAYMVNGNFEKAEKYFLKGLKDTIYSTPSEINNNHHALSYNYWLMGEYEKSIKHGKISELFFHKTGSVFFEFEDIRYQVQSYNMLAKYNEALINGNRALKLDKKINFKNVVLALKVSLSTSYIGIGEINNAEEYLLEVLDFFNNSKNVERINKQELYQNLALIYEKNNNYKKALVFYKKYLKVNKAELTEQRDTKITEIETKYQTEKKEKENQQLKLEKAEQTLALQKEKQQKTYMLSALFILLLFIGVFAYYFRRNQKQKRVIENLQKELHHRVKGNLSVISTFINLAKEEFKNPAFVNKLNELQNRIESINEIHQRLYESDDMTNLHLKKYVKTLAENVKTTFNNNDVEIINNIDENLKLYAKKTFPVGLIINEFLTNSFKYAFAENTKGEIEIKMQEIGNKISLVLSDNGKGMPKDFNIETTLRFGVRVMQTLTKQLGGTFDMQGTEGVSINIEFPK